MLQNPSFEYEQQYWDQDILLVAGIDEAGMGALAGPVVAGAAIFKPDRNFPAVAKAMAGRQFPISNFQIRDSKTLSAKQREKAAEWIKANATASAIGEATVEEITELNIRNAAHLAMRRAVEKLSLAPDILLIDGTKAQIHPVIPAINIIKGDSVSFSIAAASILAKVHRDSILVELDTAFPAFGFAQHKGYGTKTHLEALKAHGASPHHRKTYAPVAALPQKF